MATRWSAPTWELETHTDVIETTMGWTYAPDTNWRTTDANGHEHRYNHGYPTLDFVVDASHWCDGSEGWAHHDPHEAIDESHYECKTCRLTIEPSLIPPGVRTFMPGLTTCTLSGYRSDGAWLRVRVDESTARGIASSDESVRDAYVENALDRADERDIIEIRFDSR
jgi:hypothetical protein